MQPVRKRGKKSDESRVLGFPDKHRLKRGISSLSLSFASLTDDKDFARVKVKLNRVVQAADEKDICIIDNAINELSKSTEERAIFLMIEASQYFENIGDAKRALEVSEACVERSLKWGSLDLQRKVFSNVANAYSRVCNFEKACSYLERALRLAIRLKDPLLHFAALCNIVSLLHVMGLIKDAKELALRLTSFPENTPRLDYLHLQNAINGLKLARATDDIASARRFDSIAQRKLHTASLVGKTWKAYINANHAWCMLQDGSPSEASNILQEVQGNSSKDNSRVRVIVLCARADLAIKLLDLNQINLIKQDLICALTNEKILPLHREEVLRTLVDLYAVDCSRESRQEGIKYLRQLNEHLINVKHKQFFLRLSLAEGLSATPTVPIIAPTYNIPSSIPSASLMTEGGRPATVDTDHHVAQLALDMLKANGQLLESKKRTPSFCIAEDWAVAADFASGHESEHCFRVGRLAGIIARSLGYSDDGSTNIEMACRLHDIGKLATDEATHRAVSGGLIDEYSVVREHAIAGGKLLEASNDPLLQLAAVVAENHHEWWNGCGFPQGKSGLEIPIEARICAVADYYVSFVHAPAFRRPWDKSVALDQIVVMAGVQLDPSIVRTFLHVVNLEEKKYEVDDDYSHEGASQNNLYLAKVSLLSSLDL